MPCAIGIDIGGTKIAAGLVDTDSGHVLARHQRPTLPGRGGEAVLLDTLGLARLLVDEALPLGLMPASLGVGIAEIVDPHGRIQSAATFDWTDLPALTRLQSILPTHLTADVRAAALAEARFGVGTSLSSFLYVTIGTGISSCLVLDGQPLAGSRGLAGTFASAPSLFADPHGLPTPALPLEQFSSGPAIVTRYQKLAPSPVTQTAAVLARANAGSDPAAHQVVHSAAAVLGAAIAQLVNTLDPDAVVLGGGLGLAHGLFHSTLVDSLQSHLWSPLSHSIPVLHARLGLDSGIVGAAFGSMRS